ncbi:hypothetical protein Tco_0278416 [Tanacetum coccineum]
MEVPDAMISDAIKKKAGYKYYMAKKVESEKTKIVAKPDEQHVSLIKSGRGKGFMCYGDQVANVPNKLKKDVLLRKTRSLTISKEEVVYMYNELGHKLKGLVVEDPTAQALLDLRKGSKACRLESLRQNKQPIAGEGSNVAHNKYYSSSYIDSDATLYSSSLDESEESANETDDADESDMDLSNDNPQGDDDDASSLQAKEKKLVQKAKKNMRKFNFKKAIAQKFKEYDQKMEDLTNFNVSKAFEKVVQAKVLTEIKKIIPTHIPNAIANYVKPRLNTSVLEVMKTNQINLFTQSSTSTDDLSEMDLKLKLSN